MFSSTVGSLFANPFAVGIILLIAVAVSVWVNQVLSDDSRKAGRETARSVLKPVYGPGVLAEPIKRDLDAEDEAPDDEALAASLDDWKARELAMLESVIFDEKNGSESS